MGKFKNLYNKIRINRYFIIFLCISFAAGYLKEMLLLFLFVMLHELCHVLTALFFKLKIRSIEIFPFGGVARIDGLEGLGLSKEVMISIAGPAFNVVSAIAIFYIDKAGIYVPNFRYMMDINIALAFFNLMPGLPLDGGRILRAVFCYFIGYKKSTKVLVISGKAISVLLAAYGIAAYAYGEINFSLIVIPVFIFIFASREENDIMYAVIKDVINKKQYFKSKGIMETVEISAYEDACAREVLKHFDLNRYHIVVVINSDMEVKSVLTESQVFNGLSVHGSDITIGQLCRKYNLK